MTHDTTTPSAWIVRFAALIAPGARVLDLAAGRGRHAHFFAGRGAKVLAVDRDAEALQCCAGVAGVTTRIADLESGSWPLSGDTFDAIVVTNYLYRPLYPRIRAALRDDGVLLYETFAIGNAAHGRPANPDFLLRRDELLALAGRAPPLTVVAFEQGLVSAGGKSAVVQRLAAVGPARSWPPQLDRAS